MDLSTVKSTGRHGRILKEDILSHLNITSDKSNEVTEKLDATTVKASRIAVTQAHAIAEVLLEDRTVPISGFTRAMVKTMTEAMVRYKFYIYLYFYYIRVAVPRVKATAAEAINRWQSCQ